MIPPAYREAGVSPDGQKRCASPIEEASISPTRPLKVLEPSRYPTRRDSGDTQRNREDDPRAKHVKAEQLIDWRFVEEMEKNGTFERLGLR
jgi:hypothetical protein